MKKNMRKNRKNRPKLIWNPLGLKPTSNKKKNRGKHG